MDKYAIKFTSYALRDLDKIYIYIAKELLEPVTAQRLVDEIEAGVFSLEQLPYRCPERRRGVYANKGYRQLFVKNYTIVYRIVEHQKVVIIITIRYSSSQF